MAALFRDLEDETHQGALFTVRHEEYGVMIEVWLKNLFVCIGIDPEGSRISTMISLLCE